MRVRLVPLDGGAPIEVAKDLVLVGRKDDCDLRLEHKSISKLHCVIVKTDGLLLLRDLGSTNGTRVNGQRVRRAALLPNDQVSIASLRFKVHLGPGDGDGGQGDVRGPGLAAGGGDFVVVGQVRALVAQALGVLTAQRHGAGPGVDEELHG